MTLEFDFGKVRTSLMTIQKNARTKVINKALDAGGEILLEEQIIYVPVHFPDEKNRRAGGRLRDSLGIGKKTGSDLSKKVHVGIIDAQEREVVYGYYQEHGYSINGKAISGKNWMMKSFNNSNKQAQDKMKEVVMKEITTGVKK